jgi:hypothetical protein
MMTNKNWGIVLSGFGGPGASQAQRTSYDGRSRLRCEPRMRARGRDGPCLALWVTRGPAKCMIRERVLA